MRAHLTYCRPLRTFAPAPAAALCQNLCVRGLPTYGSCVSLQATRTVTHIFASSNIRTNDVHQRPSGGDLLISARRNNAGIQSERQRRRHQNCACRRPALIYHQQLALGNHKLDLLWASEGGGVPANAPNRWGAQTPPRAP